MDLGFIQESWYRAPPKDYHVSFQFERLTQRTTVVNPNGREVGSLLGAGSELSFSNVQRVRQFEVCLLLREDFDENDVPVGYILDFGYSTDDTSYIYPLHFNPINLYERLNRTFACKTVQWVNIPATEDGKYRMFPIMRLIDDSGHKEFVSRTTKILCYILGAFFAFDLLYICVYLLSVLIGQEGTMNSPLFLFISISFGVLCIFRICYLFIFPSGDFSLLAEYVVFEIPTFILFTIIIVILGTWENMRKGGMFDKGVSGPTIAMIIGVTFVWIVFIIVTAVDGTVIIDKEAEEPVCKGRVAASTKDIEDATRNLSVAYQSLVIFGCFVLSLMFFASTMMFAKSAPGESTLKSMIVRIGSLFCAVFFLRCVLFIIILAAEFSSSIYMFITIFLTEVLLIFITTYFLANPKQMAFGNAIEMDETVSGRHLVEEE